MNKFIYYYDNIIPIELQNHYETLLFRQPPYIFDGENPGIDFYYQNRITYTTSEDESDFMFMKLLTNYDFPEVTKGGYHFFQIVYYLAFHLKISVNHIYRGIISFQPPSINPKILGPHRDSEKDHWVCLYYVNDSDGDTIFYEDDQVTEIKRVSPKKGRVVFFNGSIYHSGSRPAKNHRISINFNFTGAEFNHLSANIN